MYSFTSGTIVSAGTSSPSMPGTQPVSLNISLASFRSLVIDGSQQLAAIDDRSLIHTHLARVEVQLGRLVIQLAEPPSTLEVPWRKTPARRRREIILPEGIRPEHARPIRSETRARLVAAIARGRRWLDQLIADPSASADTIAKRERSSARKINMTISLAFLAPDLVQAAINGRLPHGMGVARLSDLPPAWSRQYQMLGLPAR